MANLVLTNLIIICILCTRCISETIYCRNSTDCAGKDIKCNTNSTNNICDIQCLFAGSCSESNIFCPPNKKCTITCSGGLSCNKMTANCIETDAECNVIGYGNYALNNMQLNCHKASCIVACNGIASCLNATFDGYPDSNLTIKCNDNAIDPNGADSNFACKNINVHCPKNKNGNKLCIIDSLSQNKAMLHSDLNIYAMDSWLDIDLTEYKTNIMAGTSSMHCNNNFSSKCLIENITVDNEWNCMNKSSLCYTDYSDIDDDDIDYALIIGLSVGAFFCLIIALCIGLYLKKDEELFAEQYEQHEKYEKQQIMTAAVTASETDALKSQMAEDTQATVAADDSDDGGNINSVDFTEYKRMMQSIFCTFAGYQPWAKKRGLYMKVAELQTFLDIVNIKDDAEDVLRLIDTDICDGRITLNEWMEYFVDVSVNKDIFKIKKHIEAQETWLLLVKAIKIFSMCDKNHTGKLEYSEFQQVGTSIGLNDEETEILWHTMDTDDSGSIDIVEMFEWFRLRLYQQRGRISSQKQPSLVFKKSDLVDLEDFKSNATSMGIDQREEDK